MELPVFFPNSSTLFRRCTLLHASKVRAENAWMDVDVTNSKHEMIHVLAGRRWLDETAAPFHCNTSTQ